MLSKSHRKSLPREQPSASALLTLGRPFHQHVGFRLFGFSGALAFQAAQPIAWTTRHMVLEELSPLGEILGHDLLGQPTLTLPATIVPCDFAVLFKALPCREPKKAWPGRGVGGGQLRKYCRPHVKPAPPPQSVRASLGRKHEGKIAMQGFEPRSSQSKLSGLLQSPTPELMWG